MSTNSTKSTVLLLGGTGKVSSRIAPLLSLNGYSVLLASRSGNAPNLPNCHGINFDWFDASSYINPFNVDSTISAIFIVAPPIVDQVPLTNTFINLAITKGVKRFVLLSGSVFAVGDGPMMGAVSKHLISLDVEYAVLRPSWFMENFSEVEHFRTIRDEDRIVTAAGDGKVPFVSAHDIANVAYRALTDEVPHNTDHLILGPGLFSYDEVSYILLQSSAATFKLILFKVAEMITKALGRKITHVRITEDESAERLHGLGIPEDYSRILAQLDTYIAEHKEEIQNDGVFRVTGKQPVKFENFIQECVANGIWVKKQ